MREWYAYGSAGLAKQATTDGPVYYHGHGRETRALTGNPDWDEAGLFVSHDPEVAGLYGDQVDRIEMAPDTRVKKHQGMLGFQGWIDAAQQAKAEGYDVAEFHRPHDFVGHIIFNRDKIVTRKQAADGPDWYHGSGATFGRFDLDQDRGQQYGAKHWNSHLGAHFSSEHHTAANLAHESAVGTTPSAVYHVRLAARKVKHYLSEKDLDREARDWAEDQGYEHYAPNRDDEGWLRHHPQVKSIAHGFREHLKSQGHDGVTYGNEYEGSHLHECAIAFHPDDITITHRHTPEEDCDAGDEICPDCGHHYEGGSMGHCDTCGAPVGMEGDDDEDEHHYGSRPTEAPTTWYAFGSLVGKTAAADEPDWYHGSGAAFSRFDLDRNRKHMGWTETKHWNGFVGAHFTSEHHTAANVAEEQEGEGAQARVYHVNLAMKNPKHYDSEHDMDEEAKTWAEGNGHDHKESAYSAAHWLRHHPQVKEVAHGFRDHLKAQGHDGITYGNVFEGSYGHKCAIAFGSDDIDITKAHSLEDDCGEDNQCPECHRHHPGDFEGHCDECDHWIGEDEDDHDNGHLAHLGALTQHFAMASNSQEHNRAFGYDHPRPTYVRFGDWPADERSMNHITGHKEEGVSVYDLDKHGDPMDPDYDMDRGQHHEGCEPDCDYWDHDEDNPEFHDDTADMLGGHLEDCRRGHNTSPDRRAHLVQGDYVTHGHDDEPVLNHLKTVGHWPCDVHKFVPTAERRSPSWCYHPDHDQDDGDEEDEETHGHLGTLTQHFASDEDDLDFRDAMEKFLDLLAESTDSPTTRKILTDPESRGRMMNHLDKTTPRYAPGTFERHVDDQLKGKEAATEDRPLRLTDIDDYVGGFPGVGSCAEPPHDAKGEETRLPLHEVEHWGISPQVLVENHYACAECRRHHEAGGDIADRADCPANQDIFSCDYGYIGGMVKHLREHGDLDPIVAYHRPPGHPQHEVQGLGQQDHVVDDGHHRISAYMADKRPTIPALVFHDKDCDRLAKQAAKDEDDLELRHRVVPEGWGSDDYETDEGVAHEITAHRGGHQVGSVQYEDQDGFLHLRWIEADPQRQGTGTALLREMQRRHPGAEIGSNSYTDEGEGLFAKNDLPPHIGTQHTAAKDEGTRYWRAHPDERAFSRSDATSKEWASDHTPDPGYSCFESPKDLFGYFHPSERTDGGGSHVVSFSGKRVGTGLDSEPLVMPDMKHVQHHDWSDVEDLVGHDTVADINERNGWEEWNDLDEDGYPKGHFPKESAKDEEISQIEDLIGPRAPNPTKHADLDEEARMQKVHEDWQQHVKKHQEWQAQRKGYSPGDDLSDWDGYPHAEWVPIQVAQRFREHTGDQHKHSERNVAKIAGELKAGRGMTDPVMLLHHNEANRASLGEGNHRLKAAEQAGWTHVPMRAVRMYDGEADEGKGQSIPHSWRGSHQGRTPEMCKPSDVLSREVMGTPPQSKTAAKEAHLSLEDVISVAEHSMHEADNHGREWHLPTSKEYPKRFENPDYWEAMKPVNQFVHAALRHGGHPHPESIRTVNSDYDLDRAGGAQGLTDGLNSIHVRDHTNDLTLLHEVAHVLNRTHEGEGHDKAFADTARDLYHHFISPKAAEHFHGIVSHHPAYLDSDRSTKDSGVKEAHREEVGREGHHPGGPGVDRPEGRHRGARPGRGRLRARAARPGDAGTGPPSPRPLTWHPKAVKDVKRLDKPVQKAVQAALDGLASSDPAVLAQTHPMSKGTPLQGWSATKVSRGHRIVHQPTQDGGLHIGYVGLHDYNEAIRRLTSLGTYEQQDRDRDEHGDCHYYPQVEHEHYDIGNGAIECPYASSHTDWDRHYGQLGDVHRGLQLPTPHPDFHGLQPHQKAQAILGSLTENHMSHAELGSHWSASEQTAKGYADPGTQNRHGVVFHAAKPKREHIQTDPEWLEERASYGIDHHDDQEVPIQPHAPIHLKGVSWLEDGGWQRHDFAVPVQHVAALRGPMLPRARARLRRAVG